jgi:hypothetical protein
VHVTDTLKLAPTELRRDVVLRAFELLRKRVAVECTGGTGASAGFPRLQFGDLPEAAGTLVVRATVVDRGSRWQRVEYDATYRHADGSGELVARQVARAVGQTCALPVVAPVGPTQRADAAEAAAERTVVTA